MRTINIFGNQFQVPSEVLVEESHFSLTVRDETLRRWCRVKIMMTEFVGSSREHALGLFKKIVAASDNLESSSFSEIEDQETEWELSFEKNE